MITTNRPAKPQLEKSLAAIERSVLAELLKVGPAERLALLRAAVEVIMRRMAAFDESAPPVPATRSCQPVMEPEPVITHPLGAGPVTVEAA